MKNILNLIAYKDGNYLSLDKVGPTILDFGFIHSDATYDVCKVLNGKIIWLDEHIRRFSESKKYFRLDVNENYQEIINNLLEKNNLKDAFVWMIAWRGYPESGNPRDLSGPIHSVVYVKPYYEISADPITLTIEKTYRRSTGFNQKYKNFNWTEFTLSKFETDSFATILTDENGMLTEGMGFNLGFVDVTGILVTPDKNCLEGITLKKLSDIYSIVRKNISPSVIQIYKGAFIASTSGGITPVKQIDNIEFDTKITQEIKERYNDYQRS